MFDVIKLKLNIVCYMGHFEIAKYLINIGADVNRKSVKGKPHCKTVKSLAAWRS